MHTNGTAATSGSGGAMGITDDIRQGPEILATIIEALRAADSADDSPRAIADRIWPDVCELVAAAEDAGGEAVARGVQALHEARRQ